MKTLLSAIAALLLAGCVSVTADNDTRATTASNEMKIAFDITDGNPQGLMLRLAVIDLTRKQLIEKGVTPKLVLAFRGDASYYTQTNLSMIKEADRADAIKIAAKLKELRAAPGVEGLEQCNVPLASRKLNPADVMQEVKLVPNGWISLAEYQRKGYSYIVP